MTRHSISFFGWLPTIPFLSDRAVRSLPVAESCDAGTLSSSTSSEALAPPRKPTGDELLAASNLHAACGVHTSPRRSSDPLLASPDDDET